jgi:hypothetical protein
LNIDKDASIENLQNYLDMVESENYAIDVEVKYSNSKKALEAWENYNYEDLKTYFDNKTYNMPWSKFLKLSPKD